MGQNPFCYTKAYKVMDKGVTTGLVGLYCKSACAQAKHAPMLRQDEERCNKLGVLAHIANDNTAEYLIQQT